MLVKVEARRPIKYLFTTTHFTLQIPADFSGGSWNFTSKLYHMWSSLSYTPDGVSRAVCTPEIVRGGQLVRGLPAEYSAAGVARGRCEREVGKAFEVMRYVVGAYVSYLSA